MLVGSHHSWPVGCHEWQGDAVDDILLQSFLAIARDIEPAARVTGRLDDRPRPRKEPMITPRPKPDWCHWRATRPRITAIHEHARDVTRSFVGTEDFEQSRSYGASKKIEMRFGHLKRIRKLGRLNCAVHEAPRMSLFWPLSSRACDSSHLRLRDRHPLRLCVLRHVKVA